MTSPSGAAAAAQPPAAPHALRRDFTLRSAFSLAFAFISPIIALYAIFALGLGTSGASFWWAFPVVLAGQLLVALSLGELSSRWPIEGGLFQWSRKMLGRTYGWATGWAYIWTLIALMVATAYAASPFAAAALGVDDPSTELRLLLALGFLGLATLANVVGRKPLKIFVLVSIGCELIGSVVIGTILLVFHRENGIGDLFTGVAGGSGSFSFGPFLAAVAIVGWAFIGFESAADVAEEVEEPERNVPKALIWSLLLVAAIVMYAGLALILAIPDLPAVLAGKVDDPIAATLSAELGSWIVRPMMIVVCTGFTAGMVAVGAAVSRVVYAMARDRELPAPKLLSGLSAGEGLPINAIVVTAGISAVLLVGAVALEFYDTLIALATAGFYVAFAMPIFALLITRMRGGWEAGPFSLGRVRGTVVNVAAAAWLAFEVVNIAWPRDIGAAWYVEWGSILMIGVIGLLGVVVDTAVRRGERPAQTAGRLAPEAVGQAVR
ncbi:amino acid permease-associated region [Patulibacter medicamentivorans]|uniref:Amino acid permease-associated region n=1 Tax=Patulibacter medicamentivorans TaxID=1097667 RepID=H0E886_9ACTN|nr:amino acid permease [Patulibacter medicamentivorans]EHN10087.1 amino acid permease-associated region [Patulibacter medicamentivorans]